MMKADLNVELDLNDLDLDLDFDIDGLDSQNSDFTLLDSSSGNDPATKLLTWAEDEATTDRPYHSKRPHKKSRAGCKQCKQRKVKCDEGRPACRACTLRKETCVYPPGSQTSPSSRSARAGSASSRSPKSSREPSPASPAARNNIDVLVVAEPIFCPVGMSDAVDMEMLWFYTAETYNSFNIEGGRSGAVDSVLRVTIPQLAFQSPFLMQTLMGLSALHYKNLRQELPPEKAAHYRARAFEGYRSAIELANPQDYPALLACSLLMCALSSEMFREADTKRLYIIDWMTVWRGIGLIVEIISPRTIAQSGLAALFYRPPIDLNKSQRWIPNNLLFMVQAIQPDDDDYEHQQTYYEVLRYMGSLYQELEAGFSPIMDLRVITFFTFIPKPFIPLAKEYRPRALIILAHYCAFTKQNLGPWWMKDIADRQIQEICEELGDAWDHLLHMPRKVVSLTDRVEIGKAILQNDTWTPPVHDLYSPATRDPRVKELKMINDSGLEVRVTDDGWELMPPPLLMSKLKITDPYVAKNAIVGQRMTMMGDLIGVPSPIAAFSSSSPQRPPLAFGDAPASPKPFMTGAGPESAGILDRMCYDIRVAEGRLSTDADTT
ncbi:hypothetical protein BKA67DRAFT_532049 [Truncatella angustata]|uniref:Zn(2)-C6 fungal-type domain-containing protein n=1 Tax=Truncatella angustata TaxID=152316 RepID=A0A9P8URI7_9PEZI|nr:uncharacterized protein BKA67DRAFT_532049 [Truncatella angustata]KAH6656797.1 hypothetical protein BKA67DRAFT_532049 [Truncatella angustata]KAH8197881.1 hypothetical protein TruAng_007933 [Truncatella angustata]